MPALFDWAQLSQENHLLENLSFLATLIGLPLLLISYVTSLMVEAHRREVGTYDTLETQYVDFQKLALFNPRLDVADTPLSEPPLLSDQDLVQQRTLYMILFSLFERAYMLYEPDTFGGLFLRFGRRRQWRGWVNFMRRYAQRKSCADAWFKGEAPRRDVGQDFDDRFERHMWKLMSETGHAAARGAGT